MSKPRVTILFDTDGEPPKDQDYSKQLEESDEAEFDVARALRKLGYPFDLLGLLHDVRVCLDELEKRKPEVVFNLAEGFRRNSGLDYAVAGLLEMLAIPYTGCPPLSLQLARDKAVSKKILRFHGVRVPEFAVFRQENHTQRPSDLRFPLIVKPVAEDASVGIAQSSVVRDDKTLQERVAYIHEKLRQDAIVEELIIGREIYVAVVGNDPPKPLPPVEMIFKKEEDEELKIATFRAKWSAKYRKDKGIANVVAKDVKEELLEKVLQAGVTTYQQLHLRDYARVDMRLTPDNEVYVIEANPNPFIAAGEDLPMAAAEAGIDYPGLVELVVACARARRVLAV